MAQPFNTDVLDVNGGPYGGGSCSFSKSSGPRGSPFTRRRISSRPIRSSLSRRAVFRWSLPFSSNRDRPGQLQKWAGILNPCATFLSIAVAWLLEYCTLHQTPLTPFSQVITARPFTWRMGPVTADWRSLNAPRGSGSMTRESPVGTATDFASISCRSFTGTLECANDRYSLCEVT